MMMHELPLSLACTSKQRACRLSALWRARVSAVLRLRQVV
jgi:hypothetical protein